MSTTQSPIAVFGLGAMGTALASRLLTNKYELHIWNRTQNRPSIQDLVGRGAQLSPTPSEATRGCNVVIICMLNYESVYSSLKSMKDSELKGKVIVNLTNCTPKDSRQMNEVMHTQYGVGAYFDGAIMTTPDLIGTEASFLFVSGENEESLNRSIGGERSSVHEILQAFGRVQYLGHDAGAAALYDLALLAGMYGMFGGTLTAIALLSKRARPEFKSNETSQPDPGISDIVSSNLVPMLQALLPSLVNIAAATEHGDDDAHGHPNTMQLHGLKHILQTCEEERVDGGPLRHLTGVFEAVEKEGGGAGGMGLIGRKFWEFGGR